MLDISIRPFEKKDWDVLWSIIAPIFHAGETYMFSPDTNKEEAYKLWIDTPMETFVATDINNNILGTYYIKANQPTLGAHICNCGYMVSPDARGVGIARNMCKHSQQEAISRGFRGMQYNAVVSTNTRAVKLWESLGFEKIGIIPEGFNHKRLGFVDAYIMFKRLS